MTNWVALVAAYGAHVHLAHVSPNLASPEAEGFQPSPRETLIMPTSLVQSLQLSGRFVFQELEIVEPAVGSFEAEKFLVSSFLGDRPVF